MKGRVIGILVVFVWGLVKLPIETQLTKRMQQHRLGGYKPTASLRQQAGQAGFIAALGGMRGAVADLMWIRAYSAWKDREYGRMKLLFDVCLALQPRRENFYDLSAWHMAWNAAAYVENYSELPEEEKRRQMREYHKVGEDYALQGTANMPDSWVLWERLGTLYRDKLKDPARAHEAFAEAGKRPGRLDYVRRLAAFVLLDVPGREREAYDAHMALFRESENEWVPTLLVNIVALEDRLRIPDARRIYHEAARLAAKPGREKSAYELARDLVKAGGRQPALLESLRALEEKLGVPNARRLHVSPDDRRQPE